MIRIFNHYVHRAALRGMAFDIGLIVLVAMLTLGLQVGSVDLAVPLAGTHVVPFAACLFVINSASGLYETGNADTMGRSMARALLVLLVALPITYVAFGLLPEWFTNRGRVQLSMVAGVSGGLLWLTH